MGESDKRLPSQEWALAVDVQELVSHLESLSLSNEEFRHRQHLEMAFWYLHSKGLEDGSRAILNAIEALAKHVGHTEKFHRTITLCWIRLVAAGMAAERSCDTPDALIAKHPRLLDKQLPLRFYSKDLLYSDRARTGWVAPDIEPLPSLASSNAHERSAEQW